MKKIKKKSDQVIINIWIESAERFIGIGDFEMGGDGSPKVFKKTERANGFEIETFDGIFTITFERKVK